MSPPRIDVSVAGLTRSSRMAGREAVVAAVGGLDTRMGKWSSVDLGVTLPMSTYATSAEPKLTVLKSVTTVDSVYATRPPGTIGRGGGVMVKVGGAPDVGSQVMQPHRVQTAGAPAGNSRLVRRTR